MRQRLVRTATGLLVGGAIALGVGEAQADPQASVGLTLGAAGVGLDRKIWTGTDFHFGLHGDVLFGRSTPRDFGVGPYLEVLTHGFDEIQFGGGLSTLFPVLDPFPIVASVGAYARNGDDAFGLEPGLSGQLFFGSRSYNFHANYVMSAGLMAQLRYGLGASRETSIVVGAQIDLAILGLPLVFLVNAARGGSQATAPVR